MLFNLVCGVNYSMGIASGSFDGIDSSRVLTVNKTIDPLALSELIVYYREKPTDSFSTVVGGSVPVSCRLLGEYGTKLLLTVHNASAANCAGVEYYILGVKKQ